MWVITDDPGGMGRTLLVELDPATGKIARTTPVQGDHGWLTRWYRRGPVLLALATNTARRIDPANGAVMWSTDMDAMDEFHPTLRARSMAIPCKNASRTLCSLSLDDGKLLGRVDGVVQAATPRNDGPLYTLAATAVSAWSRDDVPDWSSALPAGHVGKGVVASQRWVLVLSESGAPPHPDYLLRALRAADGQVAWERHSAPEGYLGYLAADGELAAYYTSHDATLWVRDLSTGEEVPAHRFTGHFVISPDATGNSPPIPSGDPFLFGSYLLVPDFDLWCAMRVRPGSKPPE